MIKLLEQHHWCQPRSVWLLFAHVRLGECRIELAGRYVFIAAVNNPSVRLPVLLEAAKGPRHHRHMPPTMRLQHNLAHNYSKIHPVALVDFCTPRVSVLHCGCGDYQPAQLQLPTHQWRPARDSPSHQKTLPCGSVVLSLSLLKPLLHCRSSDPNHRPVR